MWYWHVHLAKLVNGSWLWRITQGIFSSVETKKYFEWTIKQRYQQYSRALLFLLAWFKPFLTAWPKLSYQWSQIQTNTSLIFMTAFFHSSGDPIIFLFISFHGVACQHSPKMRSHKSVHLPRHTGHVSSMATKATLAYYKLLVSFLTEY